MPRQILQRRNAGRRARATVRATAENPISRARGIDILNREIWRTTLVGTRGMEDNAEEDPVSEGQATQNNPDANTIDDFDIDFAEATGIDPFFLNPNKPKKTKKYFIVRKGVKIYFPESFINEKRFIRMIILGKLPEKGASIKKVVKKLFEINSGKSMKALIKLLKQNSVKFEYLNEILKRTTKGNNNIRIEGVGDAPSNIGFTGRTASRHEYRINETTSLNYR